MLKLLSPNHTTGTNAGRPAKGKNSNAKAATIHAIVNIP